MHIQQLKDQYYELSKTNSKLGALNKLMEDHYDHKFKHPLARLLSVEADHKTIKGSAKNYLTGVLYMAPSETIPGLNLCPMAKKAGCESVCLYTAGRGKMAPVQMARIRKTILYGVDKALFFMRLKVDIQNLMIEAYSRNMTPCVRLNGTSDILWESIQDPLTNKTILELFPDIQFYDYTKIPGRRAPANYALTFSYSAADKVTQWHAEQVLKTKQNVAVVFLEDLPKTYLGRQVISGDDTDLRFLDPENKIIGLRAKGRARYNKTKFVQT